MGLLTKIFGSYSDKELKRITPIANKINELADIYSAMSDYDLRAVTPALKERLANGETTDDILPDAFAACREAAVRILGQRPFDVQVIGGIVLHQGRIAEMKTGEGKTLTAALPAYLNALTGKGVHVVTVNDYLATRDSEWMGKIYRYLGLTVGLIVHDLSNEKRREAYNSDITYGTNNELGFDYLRDNMVDKKEKMVQRVLNFAIVDEVDSILIDEARTPLIISGTGDDSSELYAKADQFVKGLKRFTVLETDDKADMDEIVGDCDYVVDEKAKTAVLTANGVAKAERYFRVENLSDPDNFDLQHYVNNALKANGTMQRDQKYVVTEDGEVIIVDEFTGRLMQGRRFSDGLHQAIEAKEGVKVEKESKTLATITFQNYFRMYKKLSGMTGTAATEEDEFRSIYSLDVVQIPTNRPMVRKDENDAIFKTEKGKYESVVEQVSEVYKKGQPILVGTVNVDKSELLSRLFTRAGIKHNVLNAKNHLREAEIIAQAGRLHAVTIATNMAGRGTDISLGGNAEFMAKQEMRKLGYLEELIDASTAFNETDDEIVLEARARFSKLESDFKKETQAEKEQVIEAGGLFILGTERHESRRIDDQLRGRSGRQGDPGESKFFLSLEDDLVRLFGGERANAAFTRFGVDEGMEIQSGFLSKAIENAQKKIEGINFSSRKHVLEYDDVMNIQRNLTYEQRRKVLDGADVHELYEKMIPNVVERTVYSFALDDNISASEKTTLVLQLQEAFGSLPSIKELKESSDESFDAQELTQKLEEEAMALFAEREEVITSSLFRDAERQILLWTVDQKWMDHIGQMDQLRYSIGMRSVGQKDPVVEYRMEGSQMFDEMNNSIQTDAVKLIMRANISTGDQLEKKKSVGRVKEGMGSTAAPAQPKLSRPMQSASQEPTALQPIKRDAAKVGRNEPCPCGSGKKFKNCHGKE